ncbi:hypothetical protein ADEAN_000932100 [Angomonas deanei]|uniref:Uncharacterized protein n=1 Tax=Angomonas deanei TaxID=59799 RepID=A0A7G2CPL2_9TRYP|nr:hypothetical protein ADEAN_000932100 [Angomonas deanei]
MTEVSKEQVYLLEKRGMLAPEDDVGDVTRYLASRPSASSIARMPPRSLKRVLLDREVPCTGCLERQDLVDQALSTYHVGSSDRTVSSLLSHSDNVVLFSEGARENLKFIGDVFGNLNCVDMSDGSVHCFPREV